MHSGQSLPFWTDTQKSNLKIPKVTNQRK
uniref:Uncharacterized protein n=1 Tax=Rhizophora mucronata TaxID=61149 RepID=A0A2P2N4S8_RHIMU